MDPYTAIGLLASILQFLVIIKMLLMLMHWVRHRIYWVRHRARLPDEESGTEAADLSEGHELVLQQTHLQSIQYPINESLVLFVDAVGRQHRVPLYLCGTTEGFLTFLFFIFRNYPNRKLRQQILNGKFWLVPLRHRCKVLGPPNTIQKHPAILANNYECNVTVGACLQMNVEENDTKLFDESSKTLQETWELIPPEKLRRIIDITGWAEL